MPADAESSGVRLERAVQIGIVVPDVEKAAQFLESLFGIGPFHFIEWPNRPESKYYFRGRQEAIRIRQAFTQAGPIEIELIQPLEGENNAYKQFLDEKGGGIHHVLFESKNMDETLGLLAAKGVQVLQNGDGIRPGTRWALLDTEALVGFLLELRHRPGASDGASIPTEADRE